jgi:hypothetical protein
VGRGRAGGGRDPEGRGVIRGVLCGYTPISSALVFTGSLIVGDALMGAL